MLLSHAVLHGNGSPINLSNISDWIQSKPFKTAALIANLAFGASTE